MSKRNDDLVREDIYAEAGACDENDEYEREEPLGIYGSDGKLATREIVTIANFLPADMSENVKSSGETPGLEDSE